MDLGCGPDRHDLTSLENDRCVRDHERLPSVLFHKQNAGA